LVRDPRRRRRGGGAGAARGVRAGRRRRSPGAADRSGGAMRVAVVGATGNVGSVMMQLLRERAFPADQIVPFASERSRGRSIDGLAVVVLDSEAELDGFDIALFSA